ncbi:MAG: hypothetical protein GF399_11410 [Candidatus Coatesbacteria bacterium]|nr:hypothetical protein [Candidatus Coatesbacteria bacterium]
MSAPLLLCADVGSTRGGNFAWARLENGWVVGGTAIDRLRAQLSRACEEGRPVALGLECPLWLPVPTAESCLSRGREGEGNRSCFAPAGGYVAVLGLHQLCYLLSGITARSGYPVTQDWRSWFNDPSGLLLWEAFVSGPAHSDQGDALGHLRDAATALVEFARRLEDGEPASDVSARDAGKLSLAGAAMLWAGLADESLLLRREVLVVKPQQPYPGKLEGE